MTKYPTISSSQPIKKPHDLIPHHNIPIVYPSLYNFIGLSCGMKQLPNETRRQDIRELVDSLREGKR